MAVTQVVRELPHNYFTIPFSGAGANVPKGTPVIPGATGGTNFGVGIPGTATTGATRVVGLLLDNHIFSGTNSSGDATTATLVNWFAGYGGKTDLTAPSHKVAPLSPMVAVQMDYAGVSSGTSATGVAVASATSTVLTITSTEANLDGGFAYVYGGTGIGQLAFVKSSTTGAWTVSSAMGTACDSTSTLLKILPFFYETPTFLVNSTTQPLVVDSIAAAGSGRAVMIGSYIVRNGAIDILDPKAFHNTTGLNSLSSLRFYSIMAFQNTIFAPNT